MTSKLYIFGTGKLATKTDAGEPDPEHPAAPVGGFAMPNANAMAAEAPEESDTPGKTPQLMVLDDDGRGHDPYDTQTLASLDGAAFPGFRAQGRHDLFDEQDGDQLNPFDTQILPENLRVTDCDEENNPYDTTGRFEVRNIWRRVLRK